MTRTYEEEVPRIRKISLGFILGGIILIAAAPSLQPWLAVAVLVGVTVLGFVVERSVAANTHLSQGLGFAVIVVAAGIGLGAEFQLGEIAALCIIVGILQAVAAPFLATIQTVGK